MSLSELAIIAGCLVVGYLVVSFLMGGKKTGQPPKAARNFETEQPPPGRTAAPLSWGEVLDVSPAASGKEIQAAYRKQMSQYHPDKVATLGQEIREVAERKAKEIDAAYTRAKLERGFE
jgi:DnaJ-domain-containing protein 1